MLVTFNNELHSLSKKKHPTFLKNLVSFPFFCSVQSLVWRWSLTLGEWNTATLCLVQGCMNLCGSPNKYHLCLSSLPGQLQAVLTHSSFGGGGGNYLYGISSLHFYTLCLIHCCFSPNPCFVWVFFFLLSLSPTLLLGQISYTLC